MSKEIYVPKSKHPNINLAFRDLLLMRERDGWLVDQTRVIDLLMGMLDDALSYINAKDLYDEFIVWVAEYLRNEIDELKESIPSVSERN